eukprot:COSAG04_NODE_26801_length_290_cov_1.083770_1_plen_35_part_01
MHLHRTNTPLAVSVLVFWQTQMLIGVTLSHRLILA